MKASGEFNDEIVIENTGVLCGEELRELPYWETINNYLKRFPSKELQAVVWQVLADYHRWDPVVSEKKRSGGTQPVLSKEERN